jgi:alkyl hydroperoxide reductase subunit AhpC
MHPEESSHDIQLGDTAPDFTAETTECTPSLSTATSEKDGGCSSLTRPNSPPSARPNSVSSRADVTSSRARNTKLIGVSVDSVDSHRKWSADIAETQGQGLNYPLVGDEDRIVANLYGMNHPNAIETATVRTVFIIGPDKKVKLTLTYPAAIGRSVDEILRVLDGLQLSSKYSVSTPVNWHEMTTT